LAPDSRRCRMHPAERNRAGAVTGGIGHMHELSIMQGALDAVVAEAQRQGARRVLRVRMAVGALTSLVPDSLQFAFECLREDTVASDAELDIESIAASCYCETCRSEFEPPTFLYCCPGCGRSDCRVLRGREVEVRSMEVE
jgi:hydrogenase nickel incorporation protein HypA/HybF